MSVAGKETKTGELRRKNVIASLFFAAYHLSAIWLMETERPIPGEVDVAFT
jgi:hypothetical protein